jgi:hypothetical protein
MQPLAQMGWAGQKGEELLLQADVARSELKVRLRIHTGRKITYQISFSPNWIGRDLVDMRVIAPAAPETPEGVNVIRLGVLKLARFSRLKISARNWRLRRSRREVVLKAEKSQVARKSPGSRSRRHS